MTVELVQSTSCYKRQITLSLCHDLENIYFKYLWQGSGISTFFWYKPCSVFWWSTLQKSIDTSVFSPIPQQQLLTELILPTFYSAAIESKYVNGWDVFKSMTRHAIHIQDNFFLSKSHLRMYLSKLYLYQKDIYTLTRL